MGLSLFASHPFLSLPPPLPSSGLCLRRFIFPTSNTPLLLTYFPPRACPPEPHTLLAGMSKEDAMEAYVNAVNEWKS
jgi:hypothetical protein